MARRHSSPCTGKRSARTSREAGEFLTSLKERLRLSLRRHSEPQLANHTGASGWRFLRHLGIYRSDVVQFKTKTKPRGGTIPPPAGRPRAQVKERVGRTTLSSSSAMSSGRLFLDRVGRHQSPSPLRRHAQITTHFPRGPAKSERSTLLGSGSFYFALTGSIRAICARRAGRLRGPGCARARHGAIVKCLSDERGSIRKHAPSTSQF